MGIRINTAHAAGLLEGAIADAREGGDCIPEWVEYTNAIAASPSRTFTVALGTALLARATNAEVDPFALKESSGPRAYSARTLAHGVLMPAAARHGINMRSTGREPLNNQPFFRYDRIDEMQRMRGSARPSHAILVEALRKVASMSTQEAYLALVSFVQARIAASANRLQHRLGETHIDLASLLSGVSSYIASDPEGGRRGQAFVAACFDLVFEDVRTMRVNDPSRRFPGDIQVFEGQVPILAVEVRQKAIRETDVTSFTQTVADRHIRIALMVALAPSKRALELDDLIRQALDDWGVLLGIVTSPEAMLRAALLWSGHDVCKVVDSFPPIMLRRLEALEVSDAGLRAWVQAIQAAARIPRD